MHRGLGHEHRGIVNCVSMHPSEQRRFYQDECRFEDQLCGSCRLTSEWYVRFDARLYAWSRNLIDECLGRPRRSLLTL
jgi:hypothetical protein